MDLDEIKRGLRAEVKKRETEQYFTFQTNIRQMCKDVLAKLEEQDAENESLLQQNRELFQALQVMYSKEEYDKQKRKRCLMMARWCEALLNQYPSFGEISAEERWLDKWQKRWLALAEKFKEAK